MDEHTSTPTAPAAIGTSALERKLRAALTWARADSTSGALIRCPDDLPYAVGGKRYGQYRSVLPCLYGERDGWRYLVNLNSAGILRIQAIAHDHSFKAECRVPKAFR